MITNVDLEGFRDWNDKELEEALRFIRNELNDRQRQKADEALKKIKEAFKDLERAVGNTAIHLDGYYNFDTLYAEIESEVK
jgi:thymidylate kinase